MLESLLSVVSAETSCAFGFRNCCCQGSCSAVTHLYRQPLPRPLSLEAVGTFCCHMHPGEGRAEAAASLALPAVEGRASLPCVPLCCSHGHVLHLSPASDFLVARVGPSVPRQDRPVREGTRVASIETGLAAAAAKLSQQVRLLGKP